MPAARPPPSGFSLLLAAGPFTTGDALDFEPFEALLNFAHERQPAVLVLMGPFVDAAHAMARAGQMASLPEELFKRAFAGRIAVLAARLPLMRVVLLPAQADLVADPIFPQPALGDELVAGVAGAVLVPNPAVLTVNGVTIALCSSDVLLPLGTEEFARAASVDRISRLCSYLLQQGSFYPLHPAPAGTNIDYTHLEHLDLPRRPDLFLTPSQLRCFAKDVDGCVFVNPGQFCRRKATGTAALIAVGTAGTRVDFYQF